MMNRLLADALDGRKFIDALTEADSGLAIVSDQQRRYEEVFGQRVTGENRQQRRARERAERRAKARAGSAR